MKLTPTLFQNLMTLFFNEIPSPAECESYAEHLDSVEECFAWILLRSPNALQYSALLDQMSMLARVQLATPQTRRTQSNFPQAQAKSYNRISDALHSLIAADKSSIQLQSDAYQALVDFARNRSDDYHGRHSLGIRI